MSIDKEMAKYTMEHVVLQNEKDLHESTHGALAWKDLRYCWITKEKKPRIPLSLFKRKSCFLFKWKSCEYTVYIFLA